MDMELEMDWSVRTMIDLTRHHVGVTTFGVMCSQYALTHMDLDTVVETVYLSTGTMYQATEVGEEGCGRWLVRITPMIKKSVTDPDYQVYVALNVTQNGRVVPFTLVREVTASNLRSIVCYMMGEVKAHAEKKRAT